MLCRGQHNSSGAHNITDVAETYIVVAWHKLPVVRVTVFFRVLQLTQMIRWQVGAKQGFAATVESTNEGHIIHRGAVPAMNCIAL